eukprot:gene13877-15958_t
MGAGFFVEADSKRIADLATEINSQFSRDFSTAFKDAVIRNLKGNYLETNTNKNALMQYDNPSQDLKSGFVLKIGGNVKSWKRRFFVAKNKADNYRIVYYEDETMRKVKGYICCCGYQVEAFSADEVSWYGHFGIKLTSYDGSKRQWLFRAYSDAAQTEWLEVLMHACKKAKPEPLKDPVYTATFKAAFSATKAAYGFFGVCFIFGTECEMLEHLTNQILSREILDDYILDRARTNPANAKSLVLEVHRHVQKIVKPIVRHSWENCFSAVRVLKAPFELSVKASLRLLIQKETDIKAQLEPQIRQIVIPHLGEIENTICKPILASCAERLLQAYESAIEGLQVEVIALIEAVEPYADSVQASQSALLLSVEQGTSTANCLSAAQKVLWRMHTEDLIDLQQLFEISGLTAFDVYSNALDDLKLLTVNAIFTFGNIAIPTPKHSPEGSPTPEAKLAALSLLETNSDTEGHSSKKHAPKENDHTTSPHGVGGRAESTADSAQLGHSPSPSRSHSRSPSRSHSRSQSRSVSKSGRHHSRSKHHGHHSAHHSRVPVSKAALLHSLNQVIAKMCLDAVLSLRAGLNRLLLDAMESKIQESMVSPCRDEVAAAKAHVTRDVQLMINLHSVGENLVRDMVTEFVDAMIGRNIPRAT